MRRYAGCAAFLILVTASLALAQIGPPPGGSSSLTVGTTAISGGTTTRVLYDNAGVLGEYTISGSANVCMTTSCVMTTPTLGVATATSLATGGATIGSNALAVTGTSAFGGNVSVTGNNIISVAGTTSATVPYYTFAGVTGASGFGVGGVGAINVIFNGAGRHTFWSDGSFYLQGTTSELQMPAAGFLSWNGRAIATSPAAATFQYGATDAASPVAQTSGVQSVVAGTSNTAGANWTLKGSAGTGTGAGGSIIFQTAPAGSTGTAQNAQATVLTLASTGAATFTATVKTGGYLVSTLPAGTVGMRAYVTDQLTACAAIGVALTGGGGVICPTFYNGSAWVGG